MPPPERDPATPARGERTRIRVVINPAAGQDAPILAALNEGWPSERVDWSVAITLGEGDGREHARRAVDEGFDLVGVVGGDGTVAEVAAALTGTDVPLAILPGGTGNAAAQEFGIPLDLVEAARLAIDGRRRLGAVDVLRVREGVSLLRVGIGFDAQTVTGASRELKDQLGWFAYPLAALRELGDAQTARIALELDGARRELDAYAVVVANVGRLGRAGARWPGDVDPTDGLADVFVLRSMDLGALLRVGARLLRMSDADAVGDDDPLLHLQARDVKVESPDPPLLVHADGEPAGETPVAIETLHGALRLVLPPAGEDEEADA